MNRTTLLAALYGLLLAPLALADCREQLPGWLEQAHPGHGTGQLLQDERGGYRVDAGQSICKVWPARPHLTLVAVPLIRDSHTDQGESDLEVLVLSNDEPAIVARQVQPHLLDWDAIFVSGFEFDTAPYRLRQDELAFGIRIHRRNGSRLNPFYETALSLYELEGKHLRSVLNELIVVTSGGERDDECAGSFSHAEGVVVITEKVGREGYRDLLLKQKRVSHRTADVAGECKTVEEDTERQQHRIEYDEQRYLLPIEFSPA
ncbi:hypothetical protein [Pseudomonas sp. GD03944]|uniref:hypothetical protein n=1 Tax=Pseudomonas sp. GD03944 TaxID=2975409 RepID=UPI00244A7ACA|nr:hypothetical protein [Pseudomonas sp. GD03944]MDH1263095.1 hypothetical protein [Pseudomonas sp. GD03944]